MSINRRLFSVWAWLWLIWLLVLPFAHQHPHPSACQDAVFQGFGKTKSAACVACWWNNTAYADLSFVHEPVVPVLPVKIILPSTASPVLAPLAATSRAPPALLSIKSFLRNRVQPAFSHLSPVGEASFHS